MYEHDYDSGGPWPSLREIFLASVASHKDFSLSKVIQYLSYDDSDIAAYCEDRETGLLDAVIPGDLICDSLENTYRHVMSAIESLEEDSEDYEDEDEDDTEYDDEMEDEDSGEMEGPPENYMKVILVPVVWK